MVTISPFSNWNRILQRSFSRIFRLLSSTLYIYIYNFRGHFVNEDCDRGRISSTGQGGERDETRRRRTIVPSELFDRWKSNRWPWTVEVRLSRLRKPLPFNYRFIFIALLIITSTGQAELELRRVKSFLCRFFIFPHNFVCSLFRV